MLGPLCNQTVSLKTDSKTLYYSTLKLKFSPSILKHNKGWKKYASLTNIHNNCKKHYANKPVRYFYKIINIHNFSDQSINLCILQDACHELFWAFGDFNTSMVKDVQVTKSLEYRYDCALSQWHRLLERKKSKYSLWPSCLVAHMLYQKATGDL